MTDWLKDNSNALGWAILVAAVIGSLPVPPKPQSIVNPTPAPSPVVPGDPMPETTADKTHGKPSEPSALSAIDCSDGSCEVRVMRGGVLSRIRSRFGR